MKLRTMAMGAAAAATLMAAPAIAEAAWGQTTGSVNMRVDSYATAPKITTLPAGARLWIDGQKNGWYHVTYNNVTGYVSGSYVSTRVAMAPVGPGPGFNPMYKKYGPAPIRGYYQKPYWDNQHQAWYDGRRWYRNGTWYNKPTFSFSFGFGG